MRKSVMTIALLSVLSVGAYAQKSAVNKAKLALNAVNADPKNIKYEKLDEAWELIQPAMTNPESASEPETWSIAGRCQAFYMNKMLNERQATGQMDNLKFFENQYNIVSFLSKCDELEHQPTAKGKPRKREFHDSNFLLAKGPRTNLWIAGTNLFSDNPDLAIKYLDLYLKTLTDSLFHEADLEHTDTVVNDAKYIMASAYMAKQDTVSALPYLNESVESNSYGKNALYNLMQYYKPRDINKWKEVCSKGFAQYPSEGVFYKNLYQEYANEHDYSKALGVLEKAIENDPTDEFAHYYRAATYYNNGNMSEAFNAFVETIGVNAEYLEAYTGAGTCAWKLAQDSKDKAKSKEYYDLAIKYFEEARKLAPENSDAWGYQLYAVYNNSGNAAKAAEFKKYAK